MAVTLVALLAAAAIGGGIFLELFLVSLRCKCFIHRECDRYSENDVGTVMPTPSPSGFPGCFVTSASNILWVSYVFASAFELGDSYANLA